MSTDYFRYYFFNVPVASLEPNLIKSWTPETPFSTVSIAHKYRLSSFPSHQSKFAKQFRQFANIYRSYSGAGRTRYLIHNSLDNFARLGTVIILTDVFELDFRQTGLKRLPFGEVVIPRHRYVAIAQSDAVGNLLHRQLWILRIQND